MTGGRKVTRQKSYKEGKSQRRKVIKAKKQEHEKGGHMKRIMFGERVIASAGYDALCAILELEFTRTGQVSQFYDVAEDVWYGLKYADFPDRYFQRRIRGRYPERRL